MAFLARRLCVGMSRFALLQQQSTITLLNAQFSRLSTEDVPKRPKNAYFLFCDEKRQKVKADNPDLNHMELTKTLSDMYNNLPESEKARLIELQRKGFEEYQSTMASMSKERREEIREHKREKNLARMKRIRELEVKKGRPRRPPNVYSLFVKENYHKVDENLSFTERSQGVKRIWENTSEAEKERYRERSNQSMQAWKKEFKEWKQNRDN